MRSIKEIIMDRDGLTSTEADEAINNASQALQEYLDNGDICGAEDICSEYFNLEPDYILELL